MTLLILAVVSTIALPMPTALADEQEVPSEGPLTEYVTYSDGWWVTEYDTNGNIVASDGERDVPPQAASHSSQVKCTSEGAHTTLFNPPRTWGAAPVYRFRPTVPANWRAPINRGLNQWVATQNPCGSPDLINFNATQGADTTAGACVNDGINAIDIVAVGNNTWVARVCFWAGVAGRIGQVDMQFNTSYAWCDGACSNAYDIQGVAAHEWGHFLGLDHSKGTCNDYDHQVMFPCAFGAWQQTVDRELGVGDMQGASQLYPTATPLYNGTFVQAGISNPVSGQKLVPGHTYQAYFDARNDGGLPWALGGRVRIGTESPRDRNSAFCWQWLSCGRPTAVDTNISAPGKSYIAPGETGRFYFDYGIYFSTGGTSRDEWFGLVAEGITWFGNTAYHTVDVGSLGGTLIEKSVLPPLLIRGLPYPVYVIVQNNGTAPWYLGSQTRVGTTNPFNRSSDFSGSGWISSSRPSAVDSNSSVIGKGYIAPGERARFEWNMYAQTRPVGTLPENWDEKFQIVQDAWDGSSNWFCCPFNWVFTTADQ